MSSGYKVCHVVATTRGGIWMFEQLRELRDRHGCEVYAVVSGEEGPLVDELRSEGIPFHVNSFGIGSRNRLLGMTSAMLEMARFFRRERFDVVQTHIFLSMLIGRPAAWLADVPVRLAMVAGPFHLEARTSRLIDRWTCWMETMLIGSCEKTLHLYREMGIPDERLALTYYGPDEGRFNPAQTPPANLRAEFGWPEDTPLIGMVAYFYPPLPVNDWIPVDVQGRAVKGHEDLIRAAAIVLKEFPKAKFLLVGESWNDPTRAYMKEMEELVRSLGLQESVIFTGYRSDVNNILRDVDVAVQASLNENLGGTLEALLMECPTVATRVGGMVDSVRDGETGFLVEPSNPDDLARGILQMLRDPQMAHTLARAGRQLMLERFTLRRTAADLSELYSTLLQKKEKERKHHQLPVSLWRLALTVPVYGFLTVRLFSLSRLLFRLKVLPHRLYHRARTVLDRLRPVSDEREIQGLSDEN